MHTCVCVLMHGPDMQIQEISYYIMVESNNVINDVTSNETQGHVMVYVT